MLIPYGTDRPLRRPTKVTYLLLGANIAVFVAGVFMERLAPDLFARLQQAMWLDPTRPTAFGFVGYQFLHAGLMHLAANMLFLFVFGPNVEDRLGRLWFLLFYLAGGAVAGAAHCLLERPVLVGPGVRIVPPVVGASGAIAAVTGAYMVLFPKTRVRVFSLLFIIGTFELPAWVLIALAIGKDLFLHGFAGGKGVAHMAHLGGYAFGIGLSLLLLWSKVLAREPFDLFSLGRHAHRRRAFKELTSAGRSPWRRDAGVPPPRARRQADEERERTVSDARAAIGRMLSSGDIDGACDAYERLLDLAADSVMNRDAQVELANYFFAKGRHQTASVAYELFIRKFPRDRESPRIMLMLALINTRYLNDPVRAKALLAELRCAGVAPEHAPLVETLDRELG